MLIESGQDNITFTFSLRNKYQLSFFHLTNLERHFLCYKNWWHFFSAVHASQCHCPCMGSGSSRALCFLLHSLLLLLVGKQIHWNIPDLLQNGEKIGWTMQALPFYLRSKTDHCAFCGTNSLFGQERFVFLPSTLRWRQPGHNMRAAVINLNLEPNLSQTDCQSNTNTQ